MHRSMCIVELGYEKDGIRDLFEKHWITVELRGPTVVDLQMALEMA